MYDELVALAAACMAAEHSKRPNFETLMARLTQMEARIRAEQAREAAQLRLQQAIEARWAAEQADALGLMDCWCIARVQLMTPGRLHG